MSTTPDPLAPLRALHGEWRGTSRLWVMPGDPVRESPSEARVEPVAQGRAVAIRYTWAYEGAPQDGMLVLTPAGEGDAVAGVLVDSWHTAAGQLLGTGAADGNGCSILSSYPAPTGPDWGWRTTVEVLSDASWRLRMYNRPPDVDELLAVETVYERVSGV